MLSLVISYACPRYFTLHNSNEFYSAITNLCYILQTFQGTQLQLLFASKHNDKEVKYSISKKSWLISYSNILQKMGLDFLDI